MARSTLTTLIPVRSAVALLLGTLLAAPALSAQQAPLPQAPDSVQSMMAEYQEVQQRYSEVQNQAFMSSEELQERQVTINDLVVETFFSSYPEAEAHIARLDEIQIEAMAAQEAQDVELLGQLMGEAGTLQNQLQEAQDRVLESDGVKPHIESFEADLMVLMLDIDPEAQAMRNRLDELSDRIAAALPSPF